MLYTPPHPSKTYILFTKFTAVAYTYNRLCEYADAIHAPPRNPRITAKANAQKESAPLQKNLKNFAKKIYKKAKNSKIFYKIMGGLGKKIWFLFLL